MSMQDAAAAALQGNQGAAPMPQPQGPQNNAPQPGGGGSLRQVAEAYARCAQTGNCLPQDAQILKAGLPQLIQMVQHIQKILQIVGGGQPQGQPGGPNG
jgi:hypothetical protein